MLNFRLSNPLSGTTGTSQSFLQFTTFLSSRRDLTAEELIPFTKEFLRRSIQLFNVPSFWMERTIWRDVIQRTDTILSNVLESPEKERWEEVNLERIKRQGIAYSLFVRSVYDLRMNRGLLLQISEDCRLPFIHWSGKDCCRRRKNRYTFEETLFFMAIIIISTGMCDFFHV